MRSFALAIPSALFIFLLAACQGGGGPRPGVYIDPAPANLDYVSSGWTPEQIALECGVKDGCPAQVGLLIFVFPEVNGRIPFSKCTAFLSADREITSNAHCDQTASAKGYFVSVGEEKQVRRITRTVFKRHTPAEKRDRDSGRPDVGVYELDEPVHSFRPLVYANLNDDSYDRLIGYVVNNGRDASHFKVDQLLCQVRRHEALFPYDLKENPDVITAFNCSSKGGNSGGPVFAPGSSKVQGVQQGSSPRERKRRLVREKLSRDLFKHEAHDTVTITNLRCIGAPAKSCVPADFAQNQARFSATQSRAIEALVGRPTPPSAEERIRYRNVAFQTVDRGSLRFEIFHEPTCYLGDHRPLKISVPLEFLSLEMNEWGELTPRVVETRMAQFKLKVSSSSRVEVETSWPDAFADLVNSHQHPRHIWGRSFSIDLPRCPG